MPSKCRLIKFPLPLKIGLKENCQLIEGFLYSYAMEDCPMSWISLNFNPMPIDVNFIKSAVLSRDYPNTKRPEVAIAGRSNAGKSSFLNCLTKSKIAKVSQEPGKTRLLNFFDVGEHYRLVDTPGYGFAARSGSEVLSWQEMIETYFSTRENFMGLILVMDIRRDWQSEEAMIVEYLNSAEKPLLVVLTKTDRCTRNEIALRKKNIGQASGVEQVWTASSLKDQGVEEIEEYFFKNWVQPALVKGSTKGKSK
jgi:GTP-binding protein